MRQSLRILQQAIDRGLPPGPVMVDNPYVALPPKAKVYNEMESLIYHFKLIMHGIQPPVGEAYFQVEGGNGEVGFYIVSDGTKQPYRVRARPPCFPIFEAYAKMITGQTIPDRSEEHTSELQSQSNLVCRLLLEKKNTSNQSPQIKQICR